mgnify:CR=1 FL=1
MQTGKVKFFNQSKGFGFIAPDDGSEDVFVHVSAVKKAQIGEIEQGDSVQFDTKQGKRGLQVDQIAFA